MINIKKLIWAGKTALWVKVLAAISDDLSSSLKTCMVEKENWFLQIIQWLPHIHSSKQTTLPC